MGSDLSTVHGVPGQWYQVPGQAATRGHAGASAAEIHQTNSTYFSLPLDIFNLPISSLFDSKCGNKWVYECFGEGVFKTF